MRINNPRRPAAPILVAEPASAARAGMSKLLLRQGVPVISCESAAEIVPLTRQHRPGVVLLDVEMPGLDAERCAAALERLTTVVLACPRDMDATRLAALEASGALMVLVKPLTPGGVLEALRQGQAESRVRQTKTRTGPRRAA